MSFDWFVLPFSIGALILIVVLISRYILWVIKLSRADRRKSWRSVFSFKLFQAVWEVFNESLLHRKIFRVNALLGWMHMTFALGWFLLIVIGSVESKFHKEKVFNMPYDPIFLRYFEHDVHGFWFAEGFTTIMDTILLLLLVATIMAVSKRFFKWIYGMKRTTKLHPGDQIALASLWLIFPMRFIAESFTAGIYGNGGYLTQTAGDIFATFLPLKSLELGAWWTYSSALCLFFLFLPFSRYMHIPTEVFLIYLRKAGVKTPDNKLTGFSEFETYSCSRCGLCIDQCQLSETTGYDDQAVYFLQKLRRNILQEESSHNCLLCGKCTNICPVGIDITKIRLLKRTEFAPEMLFNYRHYENVIHHDERKVDVAYFGGCMTHLTPKIKIAMTGIFRKLNIRYNFVDENGSICCGRPLKLAGNHMQARDLMQENKRIIIATGAKILVTSCPICYNIFKNEYKFDKIQVLHHSEYLNLLHKEGALKLTPNEEKMVYHDPCELGRMMNIYEPPREILEKSGKLIPVQKEKNFADCCGGSLANLPLSEDNRRKVSKEALTKLLAP